MGWTDKLADFLRLNDGEQAYTGYPQMQVGLNKPRQTGYATGFLENATGLPPMQSQGVLTNPNYDAYAQGQNAGELAGIGAMALPGYAMALRAGAPKAYNALENYMVKSGGMIPLDAYHGTPHKIEGNFDIKKVGTGEGNQSFGHGMYFAENPNVAKQYQAALSDTKYKVGERELKGNEAWAAQFLHDFQDDALPKRIDVNTAVKKAEELLKHGETKAEIINNIKALDKSGLTVENGNLYKVDIPDEHIATMLDWDKPISKQSELVQSVANQLLPKIKQTNPYLDLNKATGGDFYRAYTRHRGNYPDFASEGLHEAGIKGIKYKDEKSRYDWVYSGDPAYTHAGNSFKESGYTPKEALEGMKQSYKNASNEELQNAINDVYGIAPTKTHNFVVFDPSTVKILEENGKPLSRKEILEQELKKRVE